MPLAMRVRVARRARDRTHTLGGRDRALPSSTWTTLQLALGALVLSSGAAAAPTPVTPRMKTFGHSIKAGRLLPAGNEITAFEHSCGAPPCVITQLHCPTAGPDGWELAQIRVYVDGEPSPSINVTLLEMARPALLRSWANLPSPLGPTLE